jgi:hypothetical protein
VDTVQWYARFGELEARGESECYQQWCEGVVADAELIALLDELPEPKRQPNLLFAAARYAGVAPGGYPGFRSAVLASWPQVRAIMLSHRTQTNEVGRCAALLPLLAGLPAPLALLEVGTSAGLCLYPDRYSYHYAGQPVLDPPSGRSEVLIGCAIAGPVPVPSAVPEVSWRAGIDLYPLDVADVNQMRWLDALVWPEDDARRRRLAAAIEVARSDPPRIVAGDLNDKVAGVAAQAPADATLVVFHSSVLGYLDEADRARFAATVAGLPGHWISNDVPDVLARDGGPLPPVPDPGRMWNALGLDGQAVAYSAPHGQSLHWLGAPSQ